MSSRQRRSQKQKGTQPVPAAQSPAQKSTTKISIPVEEKKIELPPTPQNVEKTVSIETPSVDSDTTRVEDSNGDGEKKDGPSNDARQALALKQEANAKFKEEKFVEAIELYTKAMALDPRNHVLFCNRSTARSKYAKSLAGKGETTLGETTALFRAALEDALACVDLKPDYAKGYVRAGQALVSLGQVDAALHLFEASLSRFPNDPALLQERDAAKQASSQARDEFPLSTQLLLNMKSSPALQRHPNEPKLSEAEEELTPSERDHLLHALFGSRYSLVPSHSPRQQWTFFYGEPPNRRSAANWAPQEARSRTPQAFSSAQVNPQTGGTFFELPRHGPASFLHAQPAWAHQASTPSMWGLPAAAPSSSSTFSRARAVPQSGDWFEQASQQSQSQSPSHLPRGVKRPRFSAGVGGFGGGGNGPSELRDLCEHLRVGQYYPDLLRQGVETVDDLLTLPPEFVQQLFPTLGHQARVLDFIRRNQV